MQVIGMDARGIEFAPIDRVVGVGVMQCRAQALELQGLDARPGCTENRIRRRQFLHVRHRCRTAQGYSPLGGSKLGRRFSRAAMSNAVPITSASGTAAATSPIRSASASDKGLLVSKWYSPWSQHEALPAFRVSACVEHPSLAQQRIQ